MGVCTLRSTLKMSMAEEEAEAGDLCVSGKFGNALGSIACGHPLSHQWVKDLPWGRDLQW